MQFTPKGSVDRLKIATINIPDDYLSCIEILVNLGYYPSRSEAVREALKQFLSHETILNDNLRNFEDIKRKQMNKMIH